ncbi:hypothetical protein D3C85_1926410 [compost metagenome]
MVASKVAVVAASMVMSPAAVPVPWVRSVLLAVTEPVSDRSRMCASSLAPRPADLR